MSEQKSIEQLQTELQTAKDVLLITEQQRDEAMTINERLGLEIEVLTKKLKQSPAEKQEQKVEVKAHSFEIDGKKYGFNFGKMTFKGVLITPLEVVADPALQKQLIESKSSMIKAI